MKSAILLNTCKEKIRKKDWIILGCIFIVLLFFFSSSNSTLSFRGRALTNFDTLLPFFMNAGIFTCAIASILMSAGSIPAEYDRKTSYLVWSRGIRQTEYHLSVAVGNSICAIATALLFYLITAFWLLQKGNGGMILRLPAAFFLTLPTLLVLSFFSSAISIKLPFPASCLILLTVFILGMFKNVLSILIGTLEGGVTVFLRTIIRFIPNFSDMVKQSHNFLLQKKVDIHIMLGTLLLLYCSLLLLHILRRKEA